MQGGAPGEGARVGNESSGAAHAGRCTQQGCTYRGATPVQVHLQVDAHLVGVNVLRHWPQLVGQHAALHHVAHQCTQSPCVCAPLHACATVSHRGVVSAARQLLRRLEQPGSSPAATGTSQMLFMLLRGSRSQEAPLQSQAHCCFYCSGSHSQGIPCIVLLVLLRGWEQQRPACIQVLCNVNERTQPSAHALTSLRLTGAMQMFSFLQFLR